MTLQTPRDPDDKLVNVKVPALLMLVTLNRRDKRQEARFTQCRLALSVLEPTGLDNKQIGRHNPDTEQKAASSYQSNIGYEITTYD